MYFRKINIHMPRLRVYKPCRRMVAIAPNRPAEMRRPFGDDHRPSAAGDFSGRARDDDLRQSARPAAAASLYQEMVRGAAIGVIACLILIWIAGASPLSFAGAVVWNSGFGALIGMLLWIGSAGEPEQPVVPPSPEQARGGKSDKPTLRR